MTGTPDPMREFARALFADSDEHATPPADEPTTAAEPADPMREFARALFREDHDR